MLRILRAGANGCARFPQTAATPVSEEQGDHLKERPQDTATALLDGPTDIVLRPAASGDVTRDEFAIVQYVLEQLLQRIERLEIEVKAERAERRRYVDRERPTFSSLIDRARVRN